MQLLVEAECARLRDARSEAADLYDRAIAAAHAAGYLNIEASGGRARGALLARATGSRTSPASTSTRRCDAYEAWGADRQGCRSQRQVRNRRQAAARRCRRRRAPRRSGPSAERSDALDLATLLKASQAIAGEIVLERLLVKLMDIIRENAGAESVVLVLESNGEFLVQGVKTARGRGARARGRAVAPVGGLLDRHRELRAAHVGARGARRCGAAGQVPQRRLRDATGGRSRFSARPLRTRASSSAPCISRTIRSPARSRRIGSRRSTS